MVMNMNIALILAGGQGLRMGGELPKQFMPLNDKPVIMHSILTFEKHAQIDEIYVVCHADWKDRLLVLCNSQFTLTKFKGIVIGGETRQQSSLKGLIEIAKTASDDDIVLIHDAARPLVTDKIITENISCVKANGACVTAIKSTDTIIQSIDGKTINSTPKRSEMFSAQTPQSFKLGTILNAHETLANAKDVTDDASLLLKLDIPVLIVDGDIKNLKLTTEEDFKVIKQYIG